MLTSSIVNGIAAPIVGMSSANCGRNVPMFAGYIIDIAQYIFLQLWVPTLDDTWVVFPIAVAYGMVDGVLQLSAQGKRLECLLQ